MEAEHSSKISVDIYQTTLHHIPENILIRSLALNFATPYAPISNLCHYLRKSIREGYTSYDRGTEFGLNRFPNQKMKMDLYFMHNRDIPK
jgi:hypothetical protein